MYAVFAIVSNLLVKKNFLFVYNTYKNFLCTTLNPHQIKLTLNIYLTDSPEVEAERATVHTGIGLEAQLVCIVHAEPAPQVCILKIHVVYLTAELIRASRKEH